MISNNGEARMMGLDTGNDAADFEAGIWLLALGAVHELQSILQAHPRCANSHNCSGPTLGR